MIAIQYANDRYDIHFRSWTVKKLLKRFYINVYNTLSPEESPKNSVQFLFGHHLFGDEIDGFEQLMDYIQKRFKIIPYSEAIALLKSGLIDDRYICFSFDDGFKNCLRITERFTARGIKGMFFVNPLFIENSQNREFLRRHCERRLEVKYMDFLSWDDISLLKKSGHEVGNHGWNHRMFSDLSVNELADDLEKGKETLLKRCGAIEHLSLPYGLKISTDSNILDRIIQSGHVSAACALRGQHFEKTDLRKNFIMRDHIVFKEPVAYFRYFYRKNNAMGGNFK